MSQCLRRYTIRTVNVLPSSGSALPTVHARVLSLAGPITSSRKDLLSFFHKHREDRQVAMSPHINEPSRSGTDRIDETTPLLTAVEPIPIRDSEIASSQLPDSNGSRNEEAQEDTEDEVPLPRTQIFLLCYTAIVEPIAFFGIFPYITFMIEKVGNVDKKDVGFYSGLIESLFSATQMCVMILWGKVSILHIGCRIPQTYEHRLPIAMGESQSWSFP
jgi:hypothetical protein